MMGFLPFLALTACIRETNDGYRCTSQGSCDRGLSCLAFDESTSICSVECEVPEDCPNDIYGGGNIVECVDGLCFNFKDRE